MPGAIQGLKEADGKGRSQRTGIGYKAYRAQMSGQKTVTSDTSIGGMGVNPMGFVEGAITYLGRARPTDLQQRGLSAWQQAWIRVEKSAEGIVVGRGLSTKA